MSTVGKLTVKKKLSLAITTLTLAGLSVPQVSATPIATDKLSIICADRPENAKVDRLMSSYSSRERTRTKGKASRAMSEVREDIKDFTHDGFTAYVQSRWKFSIVMDGVDNVQHRDRGGASLQPLQREKVLNNRPAGGVGVTSMGNYSGSRKSDLRRGMELLFTYIFSPAEDEDQAAYIFNRANDVLEIRTRIPESKKYTSQFFVCIYDEPNLGNTE